MKFIASVSAAWAVLAILLLHACASGERRQSSETIPSRGAWSSKAPMPVAIGEVTLATTGGKVYVIGGSTEDTVDQKLNQEYDI